MLQLEHIEKTFRTKYSEVRALDGISLNVKEGELVTINGKSGCGKTTLLLTAGGLLFPDKGRVRLNRQDFYSLTSEERAKKRAGHIGFVFQQFYLVPYLNVLENILAPSPGQAPDIKRASELMDRFHLTDRSHHKPSELSTGERQRTGLARALINKPKFLFADEPTGNLDDHNAAEVMNALSDFAADGGGVLLVSHDQRTSVHSSRKYVMESGKLI